MTGEDLQIADWNEDGRGRAHAWGRVMLVHGAHPGERVRMRVDRETRGTLQGRVAAFIERDPQRFPHACAHEQTCTGCAFLGLDPAAEERWKRERLQCLFAPFLWQGCREIPFHRPSEVFGYRHGGAQIFAASGSRVLLGSYVRGTHEVADNRGCPVLAPNLRAAFDAASALATELHLPVSEAAEGRAGLRHAVGRASAFSGEVSLLIAADSEAIDAADALAQALFDRGLVAGACSFAAAPGNVLLRGEVLRHFGRVRLTERLNEHEFTVDPQAFFQINPPAAALLFARAQALAGSGEHLVEGYAGSGALTAHLLSAFRRVTAIESAPLGAERLGALAAIHPGLHAISGRVEECLEAVLVPPPDVVVLDPPRAGFGASVSAQLAASAVQRLVVLACDPARLARDLPPLVDAGFALTALEGIDQFPRTAHFEVVARLERSPKPGISLTRSQGTDSGTDPNH